MFRTFTLYLLLAGCTMLLVHEQILLGAESEKTPAKSAAEQRTIDEALANKVTLEVIEVPLDEVLKDLCKKNAIPIFFDTKALLESGGEIDYQVTRNIQNISLKAALNILVRDAGLGLGWTIRNEVLLITSKDAADVNIILKVHNVRDLVVFDDDPNDLADYDTLIDAITGTIEPTTWDQVGGPASIARCDLNGIHALVISQTPEIHGQIDSLLAELRKLKAKPK